MNTLEVLQALDIRTGTIVAVDDFPEAQKPLYKVTINFGAEIGEKMSGAGLRPYYPKEDLIEKRIVAVVNLPPKKDDATNRFALLGPDKDVPNGLKVF